MRLAASGRREQRKSRGGGGGEGVKIKTHVAPPAT